MDEYERLKAQKNAILKRERQELLMLLYTKMVNVARDRNQMVGKKNDYYLTIAQIEAIFIAEEDRKETKGGSGK